MLEAQLGGCLSNPLGLISLQGTGLSARDGTKSTRTGAHIPHHHKSGGLLRVAFHAIGALRIVANRLQPKLFQKSCGEVIGIAARNLSAQPLG